MKKPKFVYDWLAPLGPIPNNETPNLLQLASLMPQVKTGWENSLKFSLSSMYSHVLRHNLNSFDIVPSCTLQEDDFFIFPFELHHRYFINTYFTAGHSPGLLELSSLQPGSNVLHLIRRGKGYLLLEYCFESYLEPALFQHMHKYFEHHEIPLNKVIYQTGSPDAAKVYNRFCDERNISTRMIVGFWDSNEYNYSASYKKSDYVGNKNFNNVFKTFLCLNRRFREHRDKLFAMFYKHNLLEHSYFSMPAEHPDGLSVKWKDQCNPHFMWTQGINQEELEHIQNNVLPLRVDDVSYGQMVSDMNRGLVNFYETSLINVVTETTCDRYALQISEKSYKPIVYKIPFIIVNSPGAIKYMKKAGYKTFSEFFDESYDDIEDPDERIVAIGNVCRDIQNWSTDTKREFFDKTRSIVDYNYQVLQDVYPNKLKGELWDLTREQI